MGSITGVALVGSIDPGVASLRRRAVSGTTDVVVVVASAGALLSVARVVARGRAGHDLERANQALKDGWRGLEARYKRSPRARVMVRVASVLLDIRLRNGRTPGARMTGIRLVDADTGGPVTVRSVLIDHLSRAAFRASINAVTGPFRARAETARSRVQDLAPEMEALQREHADDRKAQKAALVDFYKTNNVNPLTAILWLLPSIMVMPMTGLASRRRQTIAEHLAGTRVIRTR